MGVFPSSKINQSQNRTIMKKLLVLSMAITFTFSCNAQWGKKVKGNGNYTTIERSTPEYDIIAVSGWFDVDIVSGKEGNITLEGEENLLKHIETEVKQGKLRIKIEKGVNLKPSSWNTGIRITVPVENVSSVSLSGSGDINGETTLKADNFTTAMSGSGDITLDIEANSVEAVMSGSGDINLSGNTSNLEVSVSGSGDIKAGKLNANNVNANVSGSADIVVTANKMLKARVSGSGDITYKGNPKKIDTKVSGSGDISKG